MFVLHFTAQHRCAILRQLFRWQLEGNRLPTWVPCPLQQRKASGSAGQPYSTYSVRRLSPHRTNHRRPHAYECTVPPSHGNRRENADREAWVWGGGRPERGERRGRTRARVPRRRVEAATQPAPAGSATARASPCAGRPARRSRRRARRAPAAAAPAQPPAAVARTCAPRTHLRSEQVELPLRPLVTRWSELRIVYVSLAVRRPAL